LTLTARTAVTIFFTSDSNLFLRITLFLRREVGGERRVVTFPSGALLFWRETDLSLYMGLSSCFNGVAPVRRREDAKRDRDSGVKVQVDDLSRREHFSNAFRHAERKTRRDLLLLGEEGKGKRACKDASLLSLLQMKGERRLVLKNCEVFMQMKTRLWSGEEWKREERNSLASALINSVQCCLGVNKAKIAESHNP